ncbi:MAG: prepilin-type N-terminal cleavage/methylation domain-containing protein [Opitutales bacterium]|nr:prepilin-type N-terminal cleavage/methylation domain-containing protein [Opitutales bacterium]
MTHSTPIQNSFSNSRAFTLIELLTVIAIIAILAGLLFAVGNAVRDSARASRASAEISAIETALTRFEVDFGFLPEIAFIEVGTEDGNPQYEGLDEDSETAYEETSRALFFAVQGVGFFGDDIPADFEPSPTNRSLIDLGSSQVEGKDEEIEIGQPENGGRNNREVYHSENKSANFTEGPYLADPWGFPYGYYYRTRADTNEPNQVPPPFERGQRSLHNFDYFDLWSTRDGERELPADRWITNWRD